jgi:glycosyltransferase involved in cell wall biosynthesis
MNNMPSISIIIPTYNEGKLIEDSLKNILNQIITFELNSEVIVIDDCSTDDTK